MKHVKLILYFFLFFSLSIYADDSGTSGGGVNRNCSNMELISELNNISTLVTHTESGTVRDEKPDPKDKYDYYYFNIITKGTITINYTSTKKTDLYADTSGCKQNKILDKGTTKTATFNVLSGDIFYLAVKDQRKNNNYNNAYNIKLTFTPDLPLPPNISGIPNQNIQIGNSLAINLANYTTEPNGDPITYGATGLPAGMSLDTGTGAITGTPTSVGTFTVTATATDKDGSDSDTFTITVTAPPVNAVDDSFTIPPNTLLSDNVIGNDSGYSITMTNITVQPSHGTVTYDAGGFFTYTPTVGYTGNDSFTYEITDGFGTTDTATVSINVALNTDYQSGIQDFTLINPLNTRNIIGNYSIAGNTIECITTNRGVTDGYWSWNGSIYVWIPTSNVTANAFTNLTCTNDNAYNDNGYISKYIDIDNDSSTWNSSSSNFTLPSTSNGILWAGLFWQGAINNKATESGINSNGNYYLTYRTQRRASLSNGNVVYKYINANENIDLETSNANQILLKINANNYESIQASTFYYDTAFGSEGGYYAAYADVTYLLQNKNLTDGNHTATVANLVTNEGRENAIGNIGGWSLVVIYNESGGGAKARNLSVYNGYTTISSTSGIKSVQISGFKLPSSGTVNSSFSAFAGEGEYVYGTPSNSYDRMFISKFSNLSSPQNMPGATDPNNIFDAILANISRDSGNNNDVTNANGIDIEDYDVSDIMTTYRDENPNIDTIYIGLESGQDYITPSMMAFATELYRPKICIDYTVQKDLYDVTQEDRVLDTQGQGTLAITLALQSEEGDFDFVNTSIGVRLTPTANTAFNTAYYAPNGSNTLIDAIFTDTDPTAPMIAIGKYITSSGGVVHIGERYFAQFDYNLTSDFYLGKFEVDLNTTINFGTGAAPSFQSTEYDDVPRCDQNATYNPLKGSYNIERTDSASYNGVTQPEYKYPLYTQVVGKPFDFRLVAYNQNTTPYYTNELALTDYTVDVELINASPFNDAQSVFTCNNPDPGIVQALDSNGTSNMFVHFPNSSNGGLPVSSIPLSAQTDTALKNAAFRIWYLVDQNNTILPHECNGVADNSCFETVYNTYIGADDTAGLCQTACDSGSGYDYTNHAGQTGCYACLHDFYARAVCSRDNFAIRPVSYRVKISDNNQQTALTAAVNQIGENDTSFTFPTPFTVATLAAGYQYKLDAIATSYLGDTTVAKGYTRKFNTPNSTDIQSSLLFDTVTNSATCFDQNNSTWNAQFIDGTMKDLTNLTQANLVSHSNVGTYLYHVEDANWTLVDQSRYAYKTYKGVDDCALNSTISTSNTGKSGCTISTILTTNGIEYTDMVLQYNPYQFDINSSMTFLTRPNNANTYLYMNNLSNNSQMAVKLEGNITAEGYNGNILSNFTSTCAATPVNLWVDRTMTPNIVSDINGTSVPLQQGLMDYLSALNFSNSSSLTDTNATLVGGNFQNNSNKNGSATVDLYYNFRKPYNIPVNPIDVNFTMLHAASPSASSNANFTANHIPNGNYSITNGNRYFYFGRVTDAGADGQKIYDLSYATTLITQVYCDQTTVPAGINCGLLPGLLAEAGNWYRMATHTSAANDGQINSLSTTVAGVTLNGGSPLNNVTFDANGSTGGVTIAFPIAGRPAHPDIVITPDEWLKYNPVAAKNGLPQFTLHFLTQGLRWKGKGNTGNVMQTEPSNKATQRLNW